MKNLVFISFLILFSLTSYSQKEKNNSMPKKTLGEEILSSMDYPYIDKFHEALREKINGNYEEAKKLFEACLEIKQDDDAVYFGLAEILQVQKLYTAALENYKKAFNLDPDNFTYLQELAYIHYMKGNFEEAGPLFKEMCEREPRNADYRYGYIKILIYNKDYKNAIEQIDELQGQVGMVPELTGMKADLYMELKEPKKAEEAILELKNEYPDDMEVLRKVIGFYEEQGEKEKALRLLEELVKKDPENGQASYILANNYLAQKEIDNFLKIAPKIFHLNNVNVDHKLFLFDQLKLHLQPDDTLMMSISKQMVEDYPENENVLLNYGNGLVIQRKTKKALVVFREIIQSNPDNFDTWGNVLSFESRYWDYEALYEDGKESINYFPAMPYTYFAAAEGALHTQRIDEASQFLDAGKIYLLDSKIQNAQFHLIQGEIYFYKKEYKKGIVEFEKALSLDNVFSVRVIYAWALAKANIAQDVGQDLLSDINEEGRSSVYYLAKALIEKNTDNIKTGIKILEEGILKTFNNSELYDLLGDFYIQTNNPKKAVESWGKALDSESRNKVLSRKIKEEQYHAPKYY